MKTGTVSGFTLIELSIVLVIIGLAIGGVLMGQDLIRAAQVRAQIAQIQSYQAAVHTFENKFLALPGDMPNRLAQRFGFSPRGTSRAQGDGNGVIEGLNCWGAPGFGTAEYGWSESNGETLVFWVDLSQAHLIEGSFTSASDDGSIVGPFTGYNNSAYQLYFPPAKLKRDNYIYVWSGGVSAFNTSAANGINYFGLSVPTHIGAAGWMLHSSPGMTVQEASNIDKKIDDGYPETGAVVAMYVPNWGNWVQGDSGPTDGTAINPSFSTCYDNANGGSTQKQYSLTQNSGTGLNCAISFQFQ